MTTYPAHSEPPRIFYGWRIVAVAVALLLWLPATPAVIMTSVAAAQREELIIVAAALAFAWSYGLVAVFLMWRNPRPRSSLAFFIVMVIGSILPAAILTTVYMTVVLALLGRFS